jgi:hypothetical protein
MRQGSSQACQVEGREQKNSPKRIQKARKAFLSCCLSRVWDFCIPLWIGAAVDVLEAAVPSMPSTGKLWVLQKTSCHVRIHTCSGLLGRRLLRKDWLRSILLCGYGLCRHLLRRCYWLNRVLLGSVDVWRPQHRLSRGSHRKVA